VPGDPVSFIFRLSAFIRIITNRSSDQRRDPRLRFNAVVNAKALERGPALWFQFFLA
jgi:hypothetical protein